MSATAPPPTEPALRPPLRTRLTDAVSEQVDVVRAFDPGSNQLLLGVGVMAGVAATVGVVFLFMQVTHALWIEPPPGAHVAPAQAAMLDAQHHGETLLAMLMGGIVGMLSTFAVADAEPRPLLTTMGLAPAFMLASIAIATGLQHDRPLGILGMALVMGIGSYLPRFTPQIGQRAFMFGQMLFVGYLIGFLSNGAVTSGDLGWIAAILWVAAAVNVVLKLAVFIPLRRGALGRTLRAGRARARAVVATATDLYVAGDARELARVRRRLGRRLVALNDVALIVDALLETHAPIAHAAHAEFFELELTVQNIGRLADALAEADLPADVRRAVAAGLIAARDLDDRAAGDRLDVLRRFGCDRDELRGRPLESGRVLRLSISLEDWITQRPADPVEVTDAEQAAATHFRPAITLMFGNLPGAALISREAAAPAGSRRARWRLDLPAQTAIRLTVAVVAAAAVGSVVSERRFYWAVLAVFISFVGTSTSGEQVFKALNRVVGTVVGIFVGSLLAHAIGASTWSLLVIVLALGLGIYFMRASYALMVIGITITVSQLYVQLGEYSNGLLVLRLEETAIGAGVAALAALVVFPVRTSVAIRVAARGYYDSLGELMAQLAERLQGRPGDGRRLTVLSRELDSAGHQLRSAALPFMRLPFRRDTVQNNLMLFGQVSHHTRNLAAQLERHSELGDELREAAVATLSSQGRLVGALRTRLQSTIEPPAFSEITGEDRGGPLTQELRRHGDLLAIAVEEGTADERQFARHLARLDETLAELGDNLSRTRPLSGNRLSARLAARVALPR